jgi:hypothetical protein
MGTQASQLFKGLLMYCCNNVRGVVELYLSMYMDYQAD